MSPDWSRGKDKGEDLSTPFYHSGRKREKVMGQGKRRTKDFCTVCKRQVRIKKKGKIWLFANHKDVTTGRRCDGVGKSAPDWVLDAITIGDILDKKEVSDD